jgi:hypothetical protein
MQRGRRDAFSAPEAATRFPSAEVESAGKCSDFRAHVRERRLLAPLLALALRRDKRSGNVRRNIRSIHAAARAALMRALVLIALLRRIKCFVNGQKCKLGNER